MDSALPVKILDCLADLAPRKLLDYLFQFRVFLTYDLFELDRLHTGVLELREGPPGLNRLMLPPVADEQHTIIRMEAVHKLMHLPGRCQRGFIEHIEPFLAGIWLLVRVPDAFVAWMSPCLLRRASAPLGTWARNLPPCSPRPPRLRG